MAGIVIIGGGIIGASIARELSRYNLHVVVLEKHPDIAMGTTKANSGIVHAGFGEVAESLKAKLNVRGNALYRSIYEELCFPWKETGAFVIARNEEEFKILEFLQKRGRANGVSGLEILNRNRVLKAEPNLCKELLAALWAPTSAVICPFTTTIAFAENATINGVTFMCDCAVTGIIVERGEVLGVQTAKGRINAQYVINAAGVHAGDIAKLAGDEDIQISRRKGEYILFDNNVRTLVNSVVFPTPNQQSKGILVAPTVHGNIFIGPNAQQIDDIGDLSSTAAGVNEIISGARRLVPDLPLDASITQFSGLRAVAEGGDFIIGPSRTVKGLIHVAGIQSPGLSAAPAIAERVREILKDLGLSLTEKRSFNPMNAPRVKFTKLNKQEKQSYIAKKPLYGRIICRCETITEGEVVDVIHAPCGARTVDGVKRRTRAGMGRCQGGFCGSKIAEILARELKIPITQVLKEYNGSYIFYDRFLPEGGSCYGQ